ncbi:hypothetical protein [Glaciimonas soli]|uniref:Uncharacterized protein n=1 Tax=Glaciimonas soli TaxID=2590999 RepID=A0A843YTN2_9BURK|nr:hypothetical protein [Glaciimonas soli]MQR02590.1 hypothetical protein [Glaciimonas soli]
MDEEVAALVVDNGSGMEKSGFGGDDESDYAKVGSDGIVTAIQSYSAAPSPEWKLCKTNTVVGSPY